MFTRRLTPQLTVLGSRELYSLAERGLLTGHIYLYYLKKLAKFDFLLGFISKLGPQDDKNYYFYFPGNENPMKEKIIFDLSPIEKKYLV